MQFFQQVNIGAAGFQSKMQIAFIEGEKVDLFVLPCQEMGGIERVDTSGKLDDDLFFHGCLQKEQYNRFFVENTILDSQSSCALD